MKKFLIAATVVAVMAGPAYAGSCPALMQKVDAALETTTISAEDKAKVMELRQQGEQQHAAGQHDESVASLNEALKLLGM